MACKIKTFICKKCGQQFERRQPRAILCSDCFKSRKSNRNNIINSSEKLIKCFHCGISFFDNINSIRQYCSNQCEMQATGVSNIPKDKRGFKRFDVQKICNNCQQLFRTNDKDAKFCGLACSTEFTAKHSLRPERLISCKCCQKKIKTKNPTQEYCSISCAQTTGSHSIVHGKRTIYNNISFRSSWEALVAEWLDHAEFKYEYEKHKFYLNKKLGHYIPDFYIPEKDVFIEVKGLWLYNAKMKVDTFKRKYPEKKLYIIDSMDTCSLMLMLQYLYGLSHYDFNSKDINYIENRVKYTIMLMIDEMIEVLRETNYKEHKEHKPIDVEHIKEEIIDIGIFFFNLLLLLKVDYKEFLTIFKRKYTLNRFRSIFPKVKFKSIATFDNDLKGLKHTQLIKHRKLIEEFKKPTVCELNEHQDFINVLDDKYHLLLNKRP